MELYNGDSAVVLKYLPANSVDTVITDPPAGISFMGKDWDSDKGGRDAWITWLSDILTECYRVAKPGATLLCWSIPRTNHWTGMAIENAGWRVVDVVTHLFGTGFPKSLDISKGIDAKLGAERKVVKIAKGAGSSNTESLGKSAQTYNVTEPATEEATLWRGWGTALKPAAEFWYLAYKPVEGTYAENALKWGAAGLALDRCRIGNEEIVSNRWTDDAHPFGNGAGNDYETVYNVGRWPANVILDEVAAEMLDEQASESVSAFCAKPSSCDEAANTWGGTFQRNRGSRGYADTGGPSRFFYTTKAMPLERDAGLADLPLSESAGSLQFRQDGSLDGEKTAPRRNHHPTVKNLDLMRWLVRLTSTPTGGVVLDPFMGSGTTGMACAVEGRDFIGIEQNPEYFTIAERRIAWAEENKIALLRGDYEYKKAEQVDKDQISLFDLDE